MNSRLFSAAMALLCCITVGVRAAEERPFILWTPAEVEKAREKIRTQAWAKADYDALRAEKGYGRVIANLFGWLVMRDGMARDEEKAYLLSFIGAKTDERLWSDHYLTALRYDCLYDQLSADERKRLEETFRVHIRNQIDNDKKEYRKANWLPNMQWPRPFSAHLLALALRDRKLIDEIASANGGWKYYFNSYVSDGAFYNEEFGKQYSMIGEMLLWCRGLERMGMDELGYEYVGKSNHEATMRKFLRSYQLIGLPRIETGSSRPSYPRLSMGDARGGMFQHSIVAGYWMNGTGGNKRFGGSNMNGRDHRDRIVEKLADPMWYEIAHAKWPEDGWDYFLVQMRAPGQDKYYPSVLWGLDPIDPASVKPPDAPSGLYPERGFALLRAEESGKYWEGPWPAVGMRLAATYAHAVPDCFALTGLYAFNRPLYVNRQVSAGYAGVDPGWSSSIRSHCGLMVDNMEPATVSAGGPVESRCAFHDKVKFASASAKGVYPDSTLGRSLMLTKEYLLDVTSFESSRTRACQWIIHGIGRVFPDNPDEWAGSRNLVGSIYDLTEEKSFVAADRPWAVTFLQDGGDASTNMCGESWFNDRIGVRMHVMGAPGTVAHTALAPATPDAKDRLQYGAREPGQPSVVVARSAARTAFVAVHEPFKTVHRIWTVDCIQETPSAVSVSVRGEGIDDRLMLRLSGSVNEPVTVSGRGESFEFLDHGAVRIGPETVELIGGIHKACVRMPDGSARKVFKSGKEMKAVFRDGFCSVGMEPKVEEMRLGEKGRVTGPIAARWYPAMLRIATGGKAATTLTVRNSSLNRIGRGCLELKASDGLKVSPGTIALKGMEPGKELTVNVEVAGDPLKANAPGDVTVTAVESEGVPAEKSVLRVMQGVVREAEQVWPRQFSWWVYSPRYVARYDYLESAAACFLLDPGGHRRFKGGSVYPSIYQEGEPGKPVKANAGGFQAFYPVLRAPGEGMPKILEDAGTHPHGYTSAFEYRFTEDWIWVRLKRQGRVALDWSGRAEGWKGRQSGTRDIIVAPDGTTVKGGDTAKYTGPVEGMLEGSGYAHATFYPPGATYSNDLVWFNAGDPSAFTFCTEEEFMGILKKWHTRGKDLPVGAWQQGEVRRGKAD